RLLADHSHAAGASATTGISAIALASATHSGGSTGAAIAPVAGHVPGDRAARHRLRVPGRGTEAEPSVVTRVTSTAALRPAGAARIPLDHRSGQREGAAESHPDPAARSASATFAPLAVTAQVAGRSVGAVRGRPPWAARAAGA